MCGMRGSIAGLLLAELLVKRLVLPVFPSSPSVSLVLDDCSVYVKDVTLTGRTSPSGFVRARVPVSTMFSMVHNICPSVSLPEVEDGYRSNVITIEPVIIQTRIDKKNKDVNECSNIRIPFEYSNTFSEFEYSHFISVPALCSF